MNRFFSFVFLLFWLSGQHAGGQALPVPPPAPSVQDFTPIQAFLSSDWMEGRDAAGRGGFMAADYIASIMQINKLQPFGDVLPSAGSNKEQIAGRGYFQDFQLIRYQIEASTLAFITPVSQGEGKVLVPAADFRLLPLPSGLELEASPVFAGYGLELPKLEYDDYHGVNVKNKIVVMMQGYPGCQDTNSTGWRKFRGVAAGFDNPEVKIRTALKHKAAAIVMINSKPDNDLNTRLANQDVINHSVNFVKLDEEAPDEFDYTISGDTSLITIPCIILNEESARNLLAGSGIDLNAFKARVAHDLRPVSAPIAGKKIGISAKVKKEYVKVRNVLGLLPGVDTSRFIIIGAHYDHLGTGKDLIFNGADDNASGVAGMLALSRTWSYHTEKPLCNLLFAAWTAEEKGLLGSSWYSGHTTLIPGKLTLVINLDMISRSAPEDSAGRMISIGTLPVSEDLKTMAKNNNVKLQKPFTLDLWDVTGHSGSDYGSFAAKGVPVMTFFAGFHDDYHTPRDIFSRAQPLKMGEILKLVNDCVYEATRRSPAK